MGDPNTLIEDLLEIRNKIRVKEAELAMARGKVCVCVCVCVAGRAGGQVACFC